MTGVGRRTSIVSPHAATAVIDDIEDNDHCCGGGASCPPPSGPSHPTRCCSLLLMLPTAVNSGGTGAFGVWSYAWWRRRRLASLYLFVRFQSTPGWAMGGRGAA
jgi:hypothetical protein